MTMPHDLKNYRAPDAFQIVDEATAGAVIGVIAAALVLWDIYRMLVP